MPFEFIPSFHLNKFEEFEYEELVDEVVHVHEVCKFDDDPLCLDGLLRDDLIAHTPLLEQIDQTVRMDVMMNFCFLITNLRMNLLFVKRYLLKSKRFL